MVIEERAMSDRVDEFMELLKSGRIDEARAIIEREKADSKFSPDTVIANTGKPPRFTKKGKAVEIGEDGKWRLKASLPRSHKG
jgi:hypothetical protein